MVKVRGRMAPGSASGRNYDYEQIAAELIVALRGRRSQNALSRRLGYQSSVVHRWESKECWPTAAAFLGCCKAVGISLPASFEQFFQRAPVWCREQTTHREMGAEFLKQLRGRTPIVQLAALSGFNRYSISRWMDGTSEPKLPQFLALIEVTSRRLPDFISVFINPNRLPSIRNAWKQVEAERDIACNSPWSNAVLRALELPHPAQAAELQFMCQTLGIPVATARAALQHLIVAGRVERIAGTLQPISSLPINTGHDRKRALQVRGHWARVAVERLEHDVPGQFGYSLFTVSRRDLNRIRELQVEYVRAMQTIIAESTESECVALFCSQLCDLAATNA